jgi:hypothetical protein
MVPHLAKDAKEHSGYLSRYLFDGQTDEEIISTVRTREGMEPVVYVKGSTLKLDYIAATDQIDSLMADDAVMAGPPARPVQADQKQ